MVTPSWRTKAAGHLQLARISNSPTVLSNVLAGVGLAGITGWDATWGWVSVAMVAFYTAGMYLNDLCDYEVDRRERPNRPLPSGRVSKRAAWVVTLVLFASGTTLLAMVGTRPLFSGLVLIGLIVLYDVWHKTNPLSPLIMASTRAMVYVTAFVSFEVLVTLDLAIGVGLMLAYIIGLTYIAKCETNASFTQQWPKVLLLAPAFYGVVAVPFGVGWLWLVGFIAWIAFSLRFIYSGQIGAGIVRLIAGIALLDALLLVVHDATMHAFLALGAFALTLFLQRYIGGT